MSIIQSQQVKLEVGSAGYAQTRFDRTRYFMMYIYTVNKKGGRVFYYRYFIIRLVQACFGSE